MQKRTTADIYKQSLNRLKSPLKPEVLRKQETEKKTLKQLHDRLNFITNNYYVKNLKIEAPVPRQPVASKQKVLSQQRIPRGYSATLNAQRTIEKQKRQYESLQPKKNDTIDRLLSKQQIQGAKVPIQQKKNIWHSYLNQQVVPLQQQRRVRSQLSVAKDPSLSENKNRSAQSLHADVHPPATEFAAYTLTYSTRTKQGQLASNPAKVNQDSFICEAQIVPDVHLFAVCDGHGQNGHHVSQWVQQQLPSLLANDQRLTVNPRECFMRATQILQTQINNSIDTQFSGTTLVALLVQDGGKLLCANLGDSRAIVGRATTKGKFKPMPLSIDHKPSLMREQQRIHQCGGKVDSYYDQEGNPIGPMRVWVQGTNYPGLAMSRSLGDQVAASVGVSSIPEMHEYQLTYNDKFIIIASDGVWEFIDNQMVCDLVGRFYIKKDIEGASDDLMRLAYQMWTLEDDSVVDDITFIIIFIQQE